MQIAIKPSRWRGNEPRRNVTIAQTAVRGDQFRDATILQLFVGSIGTL
jgi:hypothetical protein